MTPWHTVAGMMRPLAFGAAWFVIGFLVLPMLSVLLVSLTDQPFLSLPKHGLSLQYYENFFARPEWTGSTLQSLFVAAASTFFAVVLGTLCTIACWKLPGRTSNAVRLLILLPLMVPTVIEGLAMYRLWVDLHIFDTVAGLILAHTITGMPYVLVTVSASLARFDFRLEQAARSLGASVPRTIADVIVPHVIPGILSGALFAFVHSLDELVVTLFLTSRRILTLPKQMWSGMQDSLDPTIAAVSTMLIVVTTVMIVAERVLRWRQASRRGVDGP